MTELSGNFVKPAMLMRRTNEVETEGSRATWMWILCATVMIVGAGSSYAAWYFLRQSSLFALQAIETEGHARSTHEEILKYMSMSEVTAQNAENIFLIDLDMVRASILRHPWIKDAEVHRIVPGTLAVKVTEHTPYAVVALGALYYVDDEATPFSRAAVSDLGELPVLTGLDASLYETDRTTWTRLVKTGVAFAEAAKKSGLVVGEVQLDTALGVIAHLSPSGTTATFGTADFDAKIARLKDVRALLAERGQAAESYSLDNPRRPDAVVARLVQAKTPKLQYLSAR